MDEKQKRSKRPRDVNAHAASTVALATGQTSECTPHTEQATESTPEERHAAAVTLGSKGGKARANKLPPEKRREIAQKAAQKRWRISNKQG